MLALALVSGVASSRAQAPALSIAADLSTTGWLGVRVQGPPGAAVNLAEAGDAIGDLTLGPDGTAAVARALPWRCDRRARTVVATVPGLAPAAVRAVTPSCAQRFAVRVAPRAVRAAHAVTVRVTDRWRSSDVTPRLCLRMRGRDVECSPARLRPTAATRRVVLHPIRSGRASVTLDTPWTSPQRVALRVRPRGRRLRVIAAGDSMVQVLDHILADRLRGAAVRSDAHVSTGITKPWMLNWPAHARRIARSRRPDATVVFLGANDGFALPRPGASDDVPCCSQPWIDAYAARAGAMMRALARRGAGRVYWLTLPTPRSRAFAAVFRAVNAALRDAARSYPHEVRLIDTGRVFTPGGRFRQTIRRGGKTVSVRQADGVHLSPAGDAIAASLVVAAMRRDGLR
jgi:hypothetical protein